ncbi:hypothetical protein [Zoogloea sp. LCSB751]|uniref:hypothetical protein n=1 Tax=Zoogloea sp. LCSB751 TaxID=1965277 RepID=UPI0011179F65|nr:hypothetical protein [Zoogloea sp. LCSB751]
MTKKNSFGAWQEQQMAAREALVVEFLAQSTKSKANYPGITALATAVAQHVSAIEGKSEPCSATTILRNPRYKSQLTHYLANQRGAKKISFEALPDERAKAIVTSLQLEVFNLRQDNERLQRYIEALDSEMEALKPKLMVRQAESVNPLSNDAEKLRKLENDLGRTCLVVNKILERFPDILGVESNYNRIVDLSIREGRPARIVAEETEASPYFIWLRRQTGA